MAKKSRYTSSQKKAYYTGKAYALGRNGRKIDFRNQTNRESFREGYKAGVHSLSKYPPI